MRILSAGSRSSSLIPRPYKPYGALPLHHAADHGGGAASAAQARRNLVHLVRRGDQSHPDAHIEDVVHLLVAHAAELLDEPEDGRHFPCAALDLYPQAVRQAAR